MEVLGVVLILLSDLMVESAENKIVVILVNKSFNFCDWCLIRQGEMLIG